MFRDFDDSNDYDDYENGGIFNHTKFVYIRCEMENQ